MTDPFLENAGGWTPVPDVLFRKYGYESAYLWGRIRRLCQLGGGNYTISHEALGDRIGMSRRTVFDRLKELIRDGYVEDLTPGVRNKPHTYSVQKGEEKIVSLGVQISHTDIDMPAEAEEEIEQDIDVGMRNLHSDDAKIAQPDNSTMQNLHTDYAENAQPAMQNLHLNRESLDTDSRDKRESARPKSKNQKPVTIPAFKIFVEITDFYAITKYWQTEAGRIVGDKPEDLEFWRRVVIGWTGKYPTKHNIQGMLDYYQRREIPGYQSNGASRNGHKPTGILQQTGEYLDDQPTFDPYTGKEIPARGAT